MSIPPPSPPFTPAEAARLRGDKPTLRASVALIIDPGDRRVLTVPQLAYEGRPVLPGGKEEAGEDALATCLRELFEEALRLSRRKDLFLLHVGPSCVEPDRLVSLFWVKWTALIGELALLNWRATEWMEWNRLLAESPYAAFYEAALPGGIEPLRETQSRQLTKPSSAWPGDENADGRFRRWSLIAEIYRGADE